MEDFGSIVSFDIAGGLAAGSRFAEALTLFAIAASLGSTESLVVAPELQQRDLTPEQRLWSAIGPGTVRPRSESRIPTISLPIWRRPGPQPGLIDPRSALSPPTEMLRGADGGRKRAIGRRLGLSADG